MNQQQFKSAEKPKDETNTNKKNNRTQKSLTNKKTPTCCAPSTPPSKISTCIFCILVLILALGYQYYENIQIILEENELIKPSIKAMPITTWPLLDDQIILVKQELEKCLFPIQTKKIITSLMTHEGKKPLTISVFGEDIISNENENEKNNKEDKSYSKCLITILNHTLFYGNVFQIQENLTPKTYSEDSSSDDKIPLEILQENIATFIEKRPYSLITIDGTYSNPKELDFLAALLDDSDPYISFPDHQDIKITSKNIMAITIFPNLTKENYSDGLRKINWADRVVHRLTRVII